MEDVEEKIYISNNTIIKNELEDIKRLHTSIIISGSSNVLALGLISYVNFINLEIINYISNNFNIDLRQYLKYKKIIKKVRAKLKYDEISFNDRSVKIEKENKDFYDEFKKGNIVNKLLNIPINNIGIYYDEGKMIGNTFYYAKIYNSFRICLNSNKEKIIEYSKEQGELIKIFSDVFKVYEEKITPIKKINIDSKDFNVFAPKTLIFNDNIDRTICLRMLDMICNINYYFLIISKILKENSSLRYRIAYMIWHTTYNDLRKIIEANSSFTKKIEEKEFIDILDSQIKFINKDFRDCIFHYDLKKTIVKNNYNNNELFLGLVEQLLDVSELEFKITIDIYLQSLVKLLEKTVIKSNDNF